jgi:pimeloyl-ACP methyl ester carboxylesterase
MDTSEMQLRLVRKYVQTLGGASSRLAARQSFWLAFRPKRLPVPLVATPTLAKAERCVVSGGGERLAVYRWPVAGGPAVLLAHGWNSRAARMVAWVGPLRHAGFTVVAFDMPGHGDSSGKRADGLTMANALWSVARAVGPLHGVVAHSAGALAAGMAVAGGHLFGLPAVDVQRVVLIAAVDNPLLHLAGVASVLDLDEATYRELQVRVARTYGSPIEEFSLSKIPGGWSQPTLVFHDPDDPEIPFEQSEAIAAVQPDALLVPVAKAGHHRIARHPAVIAKTISFFTTSG